MTTNAATITAELRGRVRLCPAYGPSGIHVRDTADGVLVRAIGPSQTQLSIIATTLLEHAGLVVDDAPASPWDNVHTNMIVRAPGCASCTEADRIGLRDTLAAAGITMSCVDCH